MWPTPSDTPLPEREFTKHIDVLLETGQLNPDILEYCDHKQQYALNVIKRYYSRQKRRERNAP